MKILISHVQNDYPLAEVIRSWLESSFRTRIEVEMNTDIEALKSGNAWLKSLDSLSVMESLLVVVCGPEAMEHKWFNFKLGRLEEHRLPIVLLCHSGVSRERLPAQLSECDALELDEDGFEGRFLTAIADKARLGEPPTVDELAFADELHRALRRVEMRELASEHKPLPRGMLPEHLLKVLTRLAKSAGGTMTAGQLAEMTGLPESRVLEALEGLGQRNLIVKVASRQGPDSYTISNQARDFLQQVTLL